MACLGRSRPRSESPALLTTAQAQERIPGSADRHTGPGANPRHCVMIIGPGQSPWLNISTAGPGRSPRLCATGASPQAQERIPGSADFHRPALARERIQGTGSSAQDRVPGSISRRSAQDRVPGFALRVCHSRPRSESPALLTSTVRPWPKSGS